MTGHIRSLTQRARLYEFITSESGAMNGRKAAQLGAVLATSALAGLMMSIPNRAEAHCGGFTECGGGGAGDASCQNMFGAAWICRARLCEPNSHCHNVCVTVDRDDCVP